MNDLTILESAWLRLISITEQIDRFAGLAVHEIPLHAGGKTGSTPAPQPGSQNFLANHLLRSNSAILGFLWYFAMALIIL